MMQTEDYLRRIKYTGDIHPSPDVLASLQAAHLYHVPFENLDIHAGRAIRLDLAHVYAKIVSRRRGGFCYELNGLFHWLLGQLGFDAILISARVYDRNQGDYGPDLDHAAILVTLDDTPWLVDVGFGDFALRPLQCILNTPINDEAGQFVINRTTDSFYVVSRLSHDDNASTPEYTFSRQPRRLEEFSDRCKYHQTSPDSHFRQNVICSRPTRDGRITLSKQRLIVTESGVRSESPIHDSKQFNRLLSQHFGIQL